MAHHRMAWRESILAASSGVSLGGEVTQFWAKAIAVGMGKEGYNPGQPQLLLDLFPL